MDLHLRKTDFRVDWFNGRGAGGQHRNKHANCCRITHIESGLVATGQSHRDRPSNQREAFLKLAHRLVTRYMDPDSGTPGRSQERVRTYHAVRNVVTDHVSGFESSFREVVVKAKCDEHIAQRRLAASDQ